MSNAVLATNAFNFATDTLLPCTEPIIKAEKQFAFSFVNRNLKAFANVTIQASMALYHVKWMHFRTITFNEVI